MSFPFNEFTVSMNPNKPNLLVHNRNGTYEKPAWILKDINTIENYAAAVAVEGEKLNFRHWNCAL